MAWVGTAVSVAKKAGPLILPTVAKEAPKLAQKAAAARQDKKRAHVMAWQRRGKVGQVVFVDGVRRWVITNADLTPVASIPAYESGSPQKLADALAGIDLGRCLTAPDMEVREEKEREAAERKRADAVRKAAKKADKQARKAGAPAAPGAETREVVDGSLGRQLSTPKQRKTGAD